MNPNYAVKVKEEIDKLLRVGFIRPVKQATWSPIMVVPKKNGKIRADVDYWKLNATTITNAFPLAFTNGVLHVVVGYEIYNFLETVSVDTIKSGCTRTTKKRQCSSQSGECSLQWL